MCPPGYPGVGPTLGHERKRSAYELNEKPETEEKKGGYLDDLNKEENGHDGNHLCLWIKEKIGSHNTSNSATCSDSRNTGSGVREHMDNRRNDSGRQIKNNVFDMAKGTFDIVAEYE